LSTGLRDILRAIDKRLGPAVVGSIAARDRMRAGLRTRASKPDRCGPPRNILVIKMVGMGDTVLMLTPLKRLRDRFPDARVTALVTPLSSGILASQPLVDQSITYDALSLPLGGLGLWRLIRRVRRCRFDCVIDFEQHFQLSSVLARLTGAPRRIGFQYGGSPRGRLFTNPVEIDPDEHMVDSFMKLLEPLGIETTKVESLEDIHTSTEDQAKVSAWLSDQGIGGEDILVGIHAGSGPRAPHRRWGRKEFAEIIRRIRSTLGAKIVLTGTAQEADLIGDLASLAGRDGVFTSEGRFTVTEVAALARRCSLFISNDTGTMHIAAAVGTPTIGLFGPQTPRRYAPVGIRNVAIYKRHHCSPCIQIHRGEVGRCNDAACIRQITVDDVWTEILRYDFKMAHK
jgi:ADP-heptose:LPS heptosyltransferase